MFFAVSNVTKYVPTSAVVGAYMVTFLTAMNINMFKFSDAQYAKKNFYNYNSTKEKLHKTKAPIWYYIKRAKSINLCSSLMSHRACCHTCYTIQLMHYSHFKAHSL
jgi:hypothetical protein